MSVEYYRKQIIDLRARLAKEKENKKKDNAYYGDMAKKASSPSIKVYYKNNKLYKAASHDSAIESLKKQIDRSKESLAREKARKK